LLLKHNNKILNNSQSPLKNTSNFLLVFALHFEELLMQLVHDSSSVGQSSNKKHVVVKGSKLNQLHDAVVRQTSKHSSLDTVTICIILLFLLLLINTSYFLYKNVKCKFCVVKICVYIFWQKEIDKKAALKIERKSIPPGWEFTKPFRQICMILCNFKVLLQSSYS
jgi:hypothetical protein